MSTTKYVIVYNPTMDSIPIDEKNRVVAPHEWAAAQRSQVQNDIASGNLMVMDVDLIDDTSNPIAFQAKQEYLRLTEAWEAEKAAELAAKQQGEEELKTDYDKSETTTGKGRRSSATKDQSTH
jgi:hypothetical protein